MNFLMALDLLEKISFSITIIMYNLIIYKHFDFQGNLRGEKITWKDGVKALYYLLKYRSGK